MENKTEKITDTRQINVGDIMVYTGNPRGSGMYPPDIGQEFLMETQGHITWVAIEMVERGRGYERKIVTNE